MSNVVRGHVWIVTHTRIWLYSIERRRCTKIPLWEQDVSKSWTNMMVDMGLDKIVHHDRDPCHARILNAWIKYWESYILRTRYQDNEKKLINKYKNTSFLDDEENQTYMISPENLEFKGPTRRNHQYCVVGEPLYWRDGYMWTYLYQDISMMI